MKFLEDYGCLDSGCIFQVTKADRRGMKTNGGCKCLYYDQRNHEARLRATKGVLAIKAMVPDEEEGE